MHVSYTDNDQSRQYPINKSSLANSVSIGGDQKNITKSQFASFSEIKEQESSEPRSKSFEENQKPLLSDESGDENDRSSSGPGDKEQQ